MLGGVLRPAAVLWLGEISYGVYLLHGLLLWFGGQYLFRYFNATIPSAYPQPLIFLALMPLVSVSVVLVSSATHFAVEKPGIVFGKYIIRQLHRSRTNTDS
jgi:peptidoglycan/LPS O-acetylase OafA/YrhL